MFLHLVYFFFRYSFALSITLQLLVTISPYMTPPGIIILPTILCTSIVSANTPTIPRSADLRSGLLCSPFSTSSHHVRPHNYSTQAYRFSTDACCIVSLVPLPVCWSISWPGICLESVSHLSR